MTPEAKVKKKVVEMLKNRGAYWFYASTHGFGASGVPDIVVCYCGIFIGIEVKSDFRKNPPTHLQQANLERIVQSGGIAIIVDANSVESLDSVLGEIYEAYSN